MSDLTGTGLDKETCEDVKQVASKYGYTVVCDEEDQQRQEADLILPSGEHCEDVSKIASKVGVTVLCDENAK